MSSKLSDNLTIGYFDTFAWIQQCHNNREALYYYMTSKYVPKRLPE